MKKLISVITSAVMLLTMTAFHISAETEESVDSVISELNTIKGDVNLNGEIRVADMVILNKYLFGKTELTALQGESADINSDGIIDVFDMISMRKLLIEQMPKSFLPEMSKWTSFVNSGAADISINSDGIEAKVYETGVNDWDIQVQARDLTIEYGKVYELTFDASCTTETSMNMGIIHQVGSEYPGCWYNAAYLTPELQTYTYTFTPRTEDASDWYLYFSLGAGIGEYTVKNITLKELGANIADDVADWSNQLAGGAAEIIPNPSDQTITADVTVKSDYEWDIQVMDRGLTLEKGKTYKLTVDLSCSETTTVNMGIIHQVGSEFPGCWYGTVKVTPEKKTYTYTFEMKEDTASDWYLYFSLGANTGTYTIGNPILIEHISFEPEPEYDYEYEVAPIYCDNNGKNIFGLSYVPVTDEKVPLVILSHELCSNYENMAEYAEALAGNGYAAYAFDFCGGSDHSLSDGLTTEMSVMTEVSDLETVLEAAKTWDFVDPEKIVLLGGSQGGVVTAITASRNIEEIAGTVLLYPAFILRDEVLEMFESKENIPDTFVYMGWIEVGRNYAEDIWDYDLYSELKSNTKPVMILHGDADELVPMSYSEKAAELYSDCEYYIIPEGSHGFSGKQLESAKAYILDYLVNLFSEKS